MPHSYTQKTAGGWVGSPKCPATQHERELERKGEGQQLGYLVGGRGWGLAFLPPLVGNLITHGWWDTTSSTPQFHLYLNIR